MKFYFISILAISLLTGAPGFAENLNAGSTPFSPGERLTFQLKWNFITAGTVVLEVRPIETVNGIQAFHFMMTARTTPFLDRIYKVRNQIDSYTDAEITHTILYKKKEHEGSSRADVIVSFDWDKMEAQLSNFGKKKDPIPLLPGAFDPFAIFYFTRLLEMKENTTLMRPATDGIRCVMGQAKIFKKAKINVPFGEFDTFIMEPDLKHIGGVFAKSKKAKVKLWVTADNRKLPVRIKSKVKIGSFVGELISAEKLVDIQ